MRQESEEKKPKKRTEKKEKKMTELRKMKLTRCRASACSFFNFIVRIFSSRASLPNFSLVPPVATRFRSGISIRGATAFDSSIAAETDGAGVAGMKGVDVVAERVEMIETGGVPKVVGTTRTAAGDEALADAVAGASNRDGEA